MKHLRRVKKLKQVEISIPKDEEGYLGRECPNEACRGYFKIVDGTGLPGQVPCHCPYCGHAGKHDTFFTQEQIAYVESYALNKLSKALIQDLKDMEFTHKPRGPFGIGFSLRVSGRPIPIRECRDKTLETHVVCDHCTLKYAIYGVFAYCPDCGVHNSLQILNKNLELYGKLLDLAKQADLGMAEHLTGNALEDAVSAFDGFGRETCRVRAAKATDPAKAEGMSFQNLDGARKRVQDLFAVDLSAAVTADEWDFASGCFQKRHLLSHTMGVVDDDYLKKAKDPSAVLGRKVSITPDEVTKLLSLLKKMGEYLLTNLPAH
jgi:hypothetical protein